MSAEDDLQLPDGLDDDFEDLGDFGDDLGDLGGDLADFDNAPPVEEETKGVSRFQMIEYLNQREWWRQSLCRLTFTAVLWLIFAYLAIVRSNVNQAYKVQEAVVSYVEGIMSHPGISGVRLRTPAESNMPCRCGCRHIGGFPASSCTDDGQTEAFEFLGRLPGDTAERLVAASGGFYPLGSQDMEPMTWSRIRTAEDVMVWMEHGLLPNVWGTVAGKVIRRPGLILNRNLVVGGLRARQRRANLDVGNCNLPAALQSWYTVLCRSADMAVDPFGPLADANFTIVDQLPIGVRSAFLSSTSTDGAYDAHFDVERPLSNALETATQLRRVGWLTEASTSLQIEALMLNGESGSFVILSIAFEWLNDGGITKTVRSHVFRAVPGQASVMDFLPEIFWLVMILLLLRQELWEVLKATFRRELRAYLSNFWNLVDWISIAVGVALAVYSLWIQEYTAVLATGVSQLPRAPLASDLDEIAYQSRWSKNIDDAHAIVVMRGYFQLSLFWYSSIITARMLKGSLGQAKLAMIQITLADGFWDVLHFMMIFLVIFNNFAVGGKILFGPELEGWSTYPQCCASAVMMLMGAANFDALYEVAPITSTIWYWLFILMMMFLLMNLLIVIIVDHFCQIRDSCGETAGILHDLRWSWKEFLFKLEWRRDQFREGEYKACFLGNPYQDLLDGLLQNAKAGEAMEKAAQRHCLAIRLNRKKIEDLSVEVPSADANPGFGIVKNLELRKIACDASTAQFLLDGCESFVASEKKTLHLGVLNQVRSFVSLLKQSKETLDSHCKLMEEGIVEDQEELEQIMTRLEESVQAAFEGFQELASTGIDTLAPPALGQGGEMKQTLTDLRQTAQA
ncbi:pkd2 [Symbiodinium necroappetens]|uniref:Pkd2 protein n=1 Tax=Symbiodinium necroappetens TaxID=1628268 RepID=A0A812RN11_9DINO|nr:pkd2 [Symbiodinium necroappetens]